MTWTILLLLVGLAACTDDVVFQLRHRNTILYPPSIMAYVDQPPRIQPIRLTWSPPGAAHYAEVPAVYSALWVDETHHLAEQDHIRLLTRETPVWFMAQDMPTDTDPDTYLRLYLAHDSVVYQRWSHAIMTYDMLHLTRTAAYVGGPRAVVWPCDSYDTLHRCVVANVTVQLMHNTNARTGTTYVIPRVVLDWEEPQSQVPSWIYGQMRSGQLHTNSQNRLVGLRLGADTWLIQDSDVAVDDTAPIVAAGADNDTLVLGRRLLWRTFNVFAFDAAADTWTLNKVLSGYEVMVQLLEVSAIIQAVLLAYHSTGMYMLMLDKVIRARGKDMIMFDPGALTLLDRCIITASMLLAVFQVVGGVWATGSGPYTDRDLTTALGRLAWVIVAVGGWQVFWGAIFYALNARLDPGHTRGMINVLGHASYIKLALLGELAAFLPDAAQSKYFLLAAAFFTCIYVIPSFAYTALSLLVVGAAHGKHTGYMWAAGLMELLATLTMDSAAIVYLFRATLYQHQVLWSVYAVWCMAASAGCLALLIPTLVVSLQVYRGIMSHEKLKKL